MNNEFKSNWKKKRFLFIPLMLLGAFALAAVIMLLWNWLMPVLFNLPVISIWQAAGLFILSKVLFGGFKGGGPKRGYGGPFANPVMKEKLMNMSEEEKMAFKEQWKQRCGK